VDIEVIVEIPKGSGNKYEMDHETGAIWLDRKLFTATQYPADYGFVPETLAEDGDPIDVLLLLEEPTFPGCHVRARRWACSGLPSRKVRRKLLALPFHDPRWSTGEPRPITPLLLDEFGHFSTSTGARNRTRPPRRAAGRGPRRRGGAAIVGRAGTHPLRPPAGRAESRSAGRSAGAPTGPRC